ncbi:MAG: hypothetical protein ACJ8AT_32330 [Hyalangium sp.]|uniref:hypothetical protein n=1 Tax=Hyalangium sp. TaxID=2028555 RepID=UPI0038998934
MPLAKRGCLEDKPPLGAWKGMMRRNDRWELGRVMALGVSVLFTACITANPQVPRQYAQTTDSATSACRQAPELCKPGMGEQMPTVPQLRLVPPPEPIPPPGVGAPVAAAVIGAVVIKSSDSLDAELRASIDKALAECATSARLEVMARHFKDRGPTQEECAEQVGTDSRGQPITRAMQLGVEQHQVALRCAEERLKKLKPGGFSISPRYRVDPQTGSAQYIPREVVEELLRQGRGAQLRGTIEPDIVIHEGQPQRVQDTYDFKFPCVSTDEFSSWRRYPRESPHVGKTQGEVYQQALGGQPAQVQPHIGVHR